MYLCIYFSIMPVDHGPRVGERHSHRSDRRLRLAALFTEAAGRRHAHFENQEQM